MTDFIQGENRFQSTLFPEQLDEYIAEDSSVRVIDVFIDALELSGLGFQLEPQATGRPAYHPATMLKIYVYGYLNRIHSSRRLERECQRNVELMWLTGRLAPDFKMIADFRKDNGQAIRLVCREFVMLCRKLNLFTEAKSERLNDKIAELKEEMQRLKKLQVRMMNHPDQQISLTDPDARSMVSSGRGTGMVGYNVQTAVDTKHHLIVAHEVTNVGHDRTQLYNMSKRTKNTLETDHLTVVTDRGYFRSEEIQACEEAGITTYLPKPQTSGNQAKGFFGRGDFVYIAVDEEYQCPAGERLIWRFQTDDKGRTISRYWTSACPRCAIKAQCTTGKYRLISRWEHEVVLEALEIRLDQAPEMMRVRRQTVEHPFGTLKAWMGHTHFLTRMLKRVSTEISLHVLAYNLKRVMNILGPVMLMEAIRA